MGFLHLFIVNKSGGLILHRSLGPTAPKIGTNEWLRIGSTFHSLHAIAAEASPVKLPGNKNSGEWHNNIDRILSTSYSCNLFHHWCPPFIPVAAVALWLLFINSGGG
jgi:hypothetical protein